jgi:hypothetical protein
MADKKRRQEEKRMKIAQIKENEKRMMEERIKLMDIEREKEKYRQQIKIALVKKLSDPT